MVAPRKRDMDFGIEARVSPGIVPHIRSVGGRIPRISQRWKNDEACMVWVEPEVRIISRFHVTENTGFKH